MCVLSYRAQSWGWYLKKSVFLKYLLTEQHKKSGGNQAEILIFLQFLKKSEIKKLNGARFSKGDGYIRTPFRI